MTESQQQNSSTKVYYHLDDSMPYMSEVPVPLDRLTLADFKKVFNRRKGFSYFCKEWDPHLDREVKVEITSDRQRLHKSANGLVELFLLSQKCLAGLGGADTLPKARSGAKCSNSTENPMIPITGKAVQRLPKSGTGPMHASALALSSVASSELDVGGGQRVSMITAGGTEASSDVQTLISRRAGEHLAELYNSTSEDPYNNRTSISSSGIFHRLPGAPMPSAESTIESCLDRSLLPSTFKHKRPRKQRYRKPYVPSTISSESESSYSLPRIEEVKLRLQEAPLGIAVASQDGSIFIYNIQTESAAEKCGQLEIGDQIVQIDDTRFEDLNEKQALELLRKLSTAKKTITMYVAKRGRATGGESSEEQKSDALSLLCETQQLDISQWVESTTKQNGVEKFRPFVDVPPAESQTASASTVPTVSQAQQQTKNQPALSHRPQAMDTSQGQQEMKAAAMAMDETSDEERAAYMDRRNGVGARLVPAIKQIRTKQQQIRAKEERKKQLESSAATSRPIVLGAEPTVTPPIPVPTASAGGGQTPAPAPKAQQPLHAAMEPTVILRRMVDPESRLTIRDRKWLKIPVPMSFIGEEMVDWLVENVQGFRNRKSARAFASRLMATGLIKHVANIHSFSEKCYYIFDDAIIADRLRLDEERLNGGQQQAKHPKLEVTATGANAAKSSGSGAPESNTEITYMSSNPSSPFFGPAGVQQNTVAAAAGPPPLLVIANNPRYVQGPGILNKQPQQKGPQTKQQSQANANQMSNNAIPLRTLNPPKFGHQLPVWPISPIHAFNRSQQRAAGIEQIREECESPEAQTNDYASMIQGEVNCGAQFDAQFDGLIQQQQKHQSQQPTILNNRPTTMKNENNLIASASEFAATKLKKAQQKAQQNFVASLFNNNGPTNSSSTAIVAPAALLPAPPPQHRQQFASNNNNNNQQPKQ